MNPSVLNIPANVSFIDTLAKELFQRHGRDHEELGRVTILTTTRRAARALQTAFLRESAGRPLLLPRMQPIGDVDEDELLLEGDMSFSGIGARILDLPPAIAPMRRQLLLSKLIRLKDGQEMDIAQAANLARELSRLLDQVHTEGLDFAGLENLVPGEYAEHWQITLEFLKILTRHWPDILAEDGVIDGARRRDLLLKAQADYWQAHPPADPVYAVGSTGSIPSTAHLLKIVADLPAGWLCCLGSTNISMRRAGRPCAKIRPITSMVLRTFWTGSALTGLMLLIWSRLMFPLRRTAGYIF